MNEKKAKVKLSKNYWSERYQAETTGWDMGQVSPPIESYIDQLTDKNTAILIPGCGRAYEAEYLYSKGFSNVFVLDLAPEPLEALKKRIPKFPDEHLVCSDFFHHEGSYDIILEQTFFCAIDPLLRSAYVKQSADLLKPGGKLVGLLWGVPMNDDRPPFGGHQGEYQELFTPYFEIETMEPAYNSITPRLGKELFVIFKKK